MAYDSSTQVITAPVSINDVQQALGLSDGDLGTLCRSDKINKWSKHKPVGWPSYIFKPGDGGTVDVQWWKGGDYTAPYGIDIGWYDYEHIADIFTSKERFTYKERTAPYRLADFDGYHHTGGRMFIKENDVTFSGKIPSDLSCVIVTQNGTDDLVGFDDVFSYGYLGVAIRITKSSGGYDYRLVTVSQLMSSLPTSAPEYDGNCYGLHSVSSTEQGGQNVYVFDYRMTKEQWGDYVGCEIAAMPVITAAPFNFETGGITDGAPMLMPILDEPMTVTLSAATAEDEGYTPPQTSGDAAGINYFTVDEVTGGLQVSNVNITIVSNGGKGTAGTSATYVFGDITVSATDIFIVGGNPVGSSGNTSQVSSSSSVNVKAAKGSSQTQTITLSADLIVKKGTLPTTTTGETVTRGIAVAVLAKGSFTMSDGTKQTVSVSFNQILELSDAHKGSTSTDDKFKSHTWYFSK